MESGLSLPICSYLWSYPEESADEDAGVFPTCLQCELTISDDGGTANWISERTKKEGVDGRGVSFCVV